MSLELSPITYTQLSSAWPAQEDDVIAITQIQPETRSLPESEQVRVTHKITWKEFTARISADRQGLVDQFVAMDNKLAEQVSLLQTITTQLENRKQYIALSDVTLTPTELNSLLTTEKVYTKTVIGLLMSDIPIVQAKSPLPAGYGLRGFSVASAGNLTLRLQVPVLSVGGSPITFTVGVFR